MQARRLLNAALFTAAGALLACVDGTPVSPKSPARVAERMGANASADVGTANSVPHRRVRVLRWTEPLSNDVVGSAMIGAAGGVIALPNIGATFTVPAGALTARTRIAVRALAGRRVIYKMSPDGLHFATPATLTMSLANTNAYHKPKWRRILRGGFIVSPLLIGTDDGVDTSEDFEAVVDEAVTVASFPVPHFSVVILASQIACCEPVTGGNR